MASDQQQKGINVPLHKRIAMGEKLDGTSLQPKGGHTQGKKSHGGLHHAKKK